MMLMDRLASSAARYPQRTAVEGPDGHFSYLDMALLADEAAVALDERDVGRGDRVGVWLDKSATAIAAMQGVLRVGAAYVPLDPMSPTARIASIVADCGLAAVFVSADRAAQLLAHGVDVPLVITGSGARPWPVKERTLPVRQRAQPDDLAYILYTSGSTGTPKGVCISEQNAAAFIDWAVAEIEPRPDDRLASHAPLHFDLSVFDVYAAFTVGATVCLVPEGIAYTAPRLAEWIAAEAISIWYSVPSALVLMMSAGGLLERPLPRLHTVVFAGEPFPLPRLKELVGAWPGVQFHNWYGPTETNVCTAWRVAELGARTCVPIGRATCGDRVWLRGQDGGPVADGELGEVMVDGPTVMLGYWGRKPQRGPYPTGDLARVDADGELVYAGRLDHMCKVRGHRVELGEIESGLLRHPAVREAVVVVRGEGLDARLVGFVVTGERLGLLSAKRHLAGLVPRYMIVDEVVAVDALPRTRNGKVDRRALVAGTTAVGGHDGS